MKRKGIGIEMSSPIYRKVLNEKNNGKLLENGDIMVGNTHALCKKTSILYKIKLLP